MVIRMKVKHLLLLFVALLLAVGAWLYGYPKYLMDEGYRLAEIGEETTALSYYEKVFTSFPYHPSAPEALLRAANMAPRDVMQGTVMVYPTGAVGSGLAEENPVSIKQGIEWLELLREKYPDYVYTENIVAVRLAVLYLMDGQTEKALAINQTISDRGNEFSEINQAMKYLNGSKAEPPYQLSGTVRVGGDAKSNMHVYLIPRHQNSFSSTGDEFAHTVTDEFGVYHFSGVTPGEYQVGLRYHPQELGHYYWPINSNIYVTVGSPLEKTATYDITLKPQMKVLAPTGGQTITDDQITFEWQAEPGAAYYQISLTSFRRDLETSKITGSSTTTVDDKVSDTKVSYSLEELRNNSRGVAYNGNEDGTMTINVDYVLGSIYPGGMFTWSVKAYDHDGNVLNSSAGNYSPAHDQRGVPLFTVDEQGLLEGDRLLLMGRFDESIAAYKKETNNPAALRSLATMAYYGVHHPPETRSFESDHPQEAISYLEQLPHYVARDVYLLGMAYTKAGQAGKALALYEKYPSTESYLALAELHRTGDHLNQAIPYFEQALPDNRYITTRELLVLYLLRGKPGDTDKALAMAEFKADTSWIMDTHGALRSVLGSGKLAPSPDLHLAIQQGDSTKAKRLAKGNDATSLTYELLYQIATSREGLLRPAGTLLDKVKSLEQQDPQLAHFLRTVLSAHYTEWKFL